MDTIRSKCASLKRAGLCYQDKDTKNSDRERNPQVNEPTVMEKIPSPRPKPMTARREEPMSMEEMRRQLGLDRVAKREDDSKREQQREQIMSEIMESTTRMRHLGRRDDWWSER